MASFLVLRLSSSRLITKIIYISSKNKIYTSTTTKRFVVKPYHHQSNILRKNKQTNTMRFLFRRQQDRKQPFVTILPVLLFTFARVQAATFMTSSSSSIAYITTRTTTTHHRRCTKHSTLFILQTQSLPQSTYVLRAAPKDWDAILADDVDDATTTTGTTKVSLKSQIPYDMKYNQRNCERCNQNFKAIQDAGGPGADIYGCIQPPQYSPNDDDDDEGNKTEGVFWFLGKVTHISDVSIEDCIRRLYPMIQQHAANLRPLDLFGAVTNEQLDIWYAPLNTEFDVAYNRPTCIFTKIIPPTENESTEIAKTIKSNFIGFQGEIYDRGEDGFRTLRYIHDGTPSRPEITGPVDASENDDKNDEYDGDYDDDDDDTMVAPNDEQMEQIQKALEGKDINAIYEEQEARRRRASED